MQQAGQVDMGLHAQQAQSQLPCLTTAPATAAAADNGRGLMTQASHRSAAAAEDVTAAKVGPACLSAGHAVAERRVVEGPSGSGDEPVAGLDASQGSDVGQSGLPTPNLKTPRAIRRLPVGTRQGRKGPQARHNQNAG